MTTRDSVSAVPPPGARKTTTAASALSFTCTRRSVTSLRYRSASDQQGLGAGRVVVKRIIRVTLCIEGVERIAVICGQRKAFSNSSWEVRIRNEVTTKRYCVGITLLNCYCSRLRFKPAIRNDLPLEDLSHSLRGHGGFMFLNHERAAHPRLDDMQISQSKSV